MRKTISTLIVLSLIISSSIITFADLEVSSAQEIIEKYYINALNELNKDEKLTYKNSININKRTMDFVEVFDDDTVLVVSEEGYAYAQKRDHYLVVVSYENGEKSEYKIDLNEKRGRLEDYREKRNQHLIPSHVGEYTESHESFANYFEYYTEFNTFDDFRIVQLTITEGTFNTNQSSYIRSSPSPDKQPFEVSADLFLGYLRNTNTLAHGLIDTLKDEALKAFGSKYANSIIADVADIFMITLEDGYSVSSNIFKATVVGLIAGFIEDAIDFAEIGMDIASFPVIQINYSNMRDTYYDFKTIQ